MKLDRYLAVRNLTPSEFARGASLPPSTITRLLSGERSPGFDLLKTIYLATNGEVTPDDFLPDEIVLPGTGREAAE